MRTRRGAGGMKFLKRLAFAMTLLFCYVATTAVQADGRWRHFSAPEEPDANRALLSNDVRALTYESVPNGIPLLWVGSDKGLQTFDGRNWQDKTRVGDGVVNEGVRALLAQDGTLWVGTASGINLRTPHGEWLSHDLDGREVRAMTNDGDSGAYVATASGLWHCSQADGDLTCDESLGGYDVSALLYYGGALWIGTTDAGVLYLDLRWMRIIPYTTLDGLIGNHVTSLAVDDEGGVWIGTREGVSRYRSTSFVKWRSFVGDEIRSLAVGKDGRIWAATPNGIVSWDLRWGEVPAVSPRRLNVESGDLRDDDVSLVFAAPDGMLWVVTGAGLSGLDGCWETFATSELASGSESVVVAQSGEALRLTSQAGGRVGPPWNKAQAIAIRPGDDEVWVGTDLGIGVYDRRTERWTEMWGGDDGPGLEVKSAGGGNAVLSLVWDGTGREAWAGLSHYELEDGGWQFAAVVAHYVQGKGWERTWDAADGLKGGAVLALTRDQASGELWAATDAGLSHYDPSIGRWQLLWGEGEPLPAVSALVRDSTSGELWIATARGVLHYDPDANEWNRAWTTADGLGGERVFALLRDPAGGELWAGTDGGVSHYNPATDKWDRTWTAADGLGGEQVFALLRDPAGGELWAGTDGGVSHYNPATDKWDRTWTAADGVRGNAALALARDAARGELWVGTDEGVSRLRQCGRPRPWVRVVRALAGGENRLEAGERVKLLDARAVVYQFEGGSFAAELGDLRYHYQLIGSDPKPHQLTPEQGLEISYSNLDYGEYTLKMWVQDKEGRKSAEREYPLLVQARPLVTVTSVLGHDLGGNEPISFSVRARGKVPLRAVWSDPDAGAEPPTVQVGWFDIPLDKVYVVQAGDTLMAIAKAFYDSEAEYKRIADYNGLADPDVITVGQRLRIPVATPPDALCPSAKVGVNCWVVPSEVVVQGSEISFVAPVPNVGGTHQFLVRLVDAQGNGSLPRPPLVFQVAPSIAWKNYVPWVGLLVGLLIVAGTAYALRDYPAYAERWGAAHGHPVQQIIPLLAPLNSPFGVSSVRDLLHERQAFTTIDQVGDALESLVRNRVLERADGGQYRFPRPFIAWLHRLRHFHRVSTLAEAVRSRHPLYAGARAFFSQAGFAIRDLGPEAFLLIPTKNTYPYAAYGTIYTRLIAGRPPRGDDFERVAEMASRLYGGRVEHRLAFVVGNRRPTPGARLRLYEIRQSTGLAIVALDSDLFGQVKPNLPAGDILAAQIDQATGRQDLYAISGPVSDDLSFFGRETLLQELVDLLDAGQPVGIFGLRKTGKTSLVQRLQGRLATRRVIAALDTQGLAREQGLLPLYLAVIEAFVSHIHQYRPGLARSMPSLQLWPPPRGRALSPSIVRVFLDDLKLLHKLLGGDERLLLILDEVDRLLPSGSDPGYEGFATFFGQLRAANQGLKVLDFILVGVDPAINRRDRWGDRDNELYRALREVWMPPMRPEAVREMVESMGFQMGIQYDPDALSLIVRVGGGQPFITRQICSQIVGDLLGRGTARITLARAREGIEEYVYRPDSYLAELWRVRLDDAQRELLLRLAQADGPLSRSALLPGSHRQEALARLGALETRTLIRREDDGYVIGWEVLRLWIRWIELGLEEEW